MCTVLLSPGGYTIAVNKYIISYHIISYQMPTERITSSTIALLLFLSLPEKMNILIQTELFPSQ